MKQIRSQVFETNSSSSHSLTISTSELMFSPMVFSNWELVKSTGVVEIYLGEFGWDFEDFYAIEEKLSYLVTDLLNHISYDADFEDIVENNSSLKKVDSVLFERTGVRLKIMPSTGYVDHQSAGFAENLIKNTTELEYFLFSPNSYFSTGNDNV